LLVHILTPWQRRILRGGSGEETAATSSASVVLSGGGGAVKDGHQVGSITFVCVTHYSLHSMLSLFLNR
jgi:hypothetical protein